MTLCVLSCGICEVYYVYILGFFLLCLLPFSYRKYWTINNKNSLLIGWTGNKNLMDSDISHLCHMVAQCDWFITKLHKAPLGTCEGALRSMRAYEPGGCDSSEHWLFLPLPHFVLSSRSPLLLLTEPICYMFIIYFPINASSLVELYF